MPENLCIRAPYPVPRSEYCDTVDPDKPFVRASSTHSRQGDTLRRILRDTRYCSMCWGWAGERWFVRKEDFRGRMGDNESRTNMQLSVRQLVLNRKNRTELRLKRVYNVLVIAVYKLFNPKNAP